MTIVSHSKCKKCHKILNLSELKENDTAEGLICIDNKSCKKRIAGNKQKSTQNKIGK